MDSHKLNVTINITRLYKITLYWFYFSCSQVYGSGCTSGFWRLLVLLARTSTPSQQHRMYLSFPCMS